MTLVLRRLRRPPRSRSTRPSAPRSGRRSSSAGAGRRSPGGALSFWTAPSSGPAVSSLAEPFDARTFWPCVDDPADKAVTTVAVTVPEGYVAASAGLGASAPAEAGKVTWTWRLPQPIPTYLVSVAVARYETISAEYRSLDGTRTMPVVGYVVPEHVGHQPGAGRVDGRPPRGPRLALRRVPVPRHEVRDRRGELRREGWSTRR